MSLAHNALRKANVLEQLAHDHCVEALIGKRECRLDISENRLYPELRSGCERHAIDVHTDDVIAVEKGASECPRPTTEIENPLPW